MILSPMATGNGAYIVHHCLSQYIRPYCMAGYHPYFTFFPFLLPLITSHQRPKIIHTTPDFAVFFTRRDLPLVLTFHNYVLDPFMRPYSSWLQRIHYATSLRYFTKIALLKAQTITAVSRFTASIACQDLGSRWPIDIIYNGVDTEMLSPLISKSESREVKVLFSGNLTQRKGAQWLAPIADRLENHIKIFYTQGLRQQGKLPQHDRLIPIGPVEFRRMPARYREMDILLMPTVREGFSMAVLEAMACGLPVVATNCSSLPEQIDNGKGGFLCGIGDVEDFAEKVNILADSSKLRKEMGAYNRSKTEENFTIKRMVSQYRSLFERVM